MDSKSCKRYVDDSDEDDTTSKQRRPHKIHRSTAKPTPESSAHQRENDTKSAAVPKTKELPPALFEANELRRTQKYQRENALLDKVHDNALARSMAEGRPLLKGWENSKLVRPIQKKHPRTIREAPQKTVTIKNAHKKPLLEGQGRKLSLSPVFPIRPPAPADEVIPLDLDGSELWPVGKFVALAQHRDRSLRIVCYPRDGSASADNF